MKEKILIVTSVYPPQICGVADYVYKMMHSKEGKCLELFHTPDWSLQSLFEKIKQIRNSKAQVINLQYPSAAYGYGIVPHLICIYFSLFSKKIFSVTIHEYSQMGWKGRLSNILFLIFANQFELDYAIHINPYIKKKSKIIKIYTNIKASNDILAIPERKYDVGYFGLIRDNKGLEEFIDVIGELKRYDPKLIVYVMGQTQAQLSIHQREILNKLEEIDVILLLNKDENEVASILANTKIAYLPFPDGVSERRGSFLAVVQNRCIVVTTKGPFTIASHDKICIYTNKENAKDTILKTLKMDLSFFENKQHLIADFIKNDMPKSWDDIILNYKKFLFK